MNFDAKAASWDSNPRNIERTQAVAQAIQARVPLSQQLTGFDYGCGTGLLSFHFQLLHLHMEAAVWTKNQ